MGTGGRDCVRVGGGGGLPYLGSQQHKGATTVVVGLLGL